MRLAVNIDHIATLREARKGHEPEPLAAALIAEMAGAQGITVHLRGRPPSHPGPGRRAAAQDDLDQAQRRDGGHRRDGRDRRADQALPGDARAGASAGADDRRRARRRRARRRGPGVSSRAMHDAGVQVSIFLDPDTGAGPEGQGRRCRRDRDQHRAATPKRRRAAAAAELDAHSPRRRAPRAADGLEVLAGHGLNYVNVIPIAAIRRDRRAEHRPQHRVARGRWSGMDRAVRDMVALLGR